MHAVVIPVRFNDRAAAESELPGVVSQVSSMPGFVAGYWLALSEERGTSLIVFESEEGAQTLANVAHGAPHQSVTPGNIEVGKVLAHT